MKYIFGILAFFLVIAIFLFGVFHLSRSADTTQNPMSRHTLLPTASPSPMPSKTTTTLFVPYWTLDTKALPTAYTQIAYFGVTADENGIVMAEDGYKDLPRFFQTVSPNQKTLLVVRLLDADVNEKILTDRSLRDTIITQSIHIAKQYDFSGVVLDFEYNALAFDTVVNTITHLSDDFASQVHAAGLSYYQTLYGDTFYRVRPFDVAAIGKASDGIFIMAYDFHKANGNPGPNFPLHPLSDEDYSFTQMVQDFTSKVPMRKVTVIFGLFGYDWTMNNKNESLGQANTLTMNEAEKEFFPSCSLKNCTAVRDTSSAERHVQYTGSDGRTHEVWFEDMDSVSKKQAFLKSKGIGSIGFWAYSYF